MFKEHTQLRGRGSVANPTGRFEKFQVEADADLPPAEEQSAPNTQFIKDISRSIIAYNTSPDVGFDASVNPYRGCEHGCVYCYARPTHEYFGYSAGLDFETKILVKENAPQLLERELASPDWQPQVVALSGVTDPYQPIERKLELTRRCLEVFLRFRNPVVIITKNHLVTRDMDILKQMAEFNLIRVFISITTLDKKLSASMEPRTSTPARRFAAIEALTAKGVPTGVLVGPVIPALTDHELMDIITVAAKAGAGFARYITLRLPHGVKSLFEKWLEVHYPNRKEKVLNRVRSLRGGKLYDSEFYSRMKGEGIFAEHIRNTFEVACRQAGINKQKPHLTVTNFRRPGDNQMTIPF